MINLDKYKNEIRTSICYQLENLKVKEEKCNDNIVGVVNYSENKWTLIENYILSAHRIKNIDKVNIKNKKNKRIIIILESPHKDEYINKRNKCIGYPALGQTGKNIDVYLEDIINKKLAGKIDNKYKYDIILMNSIQYQTSLGKDTKVFRDRIWLTLWIKNKLRDNFIKRLKEYKPDIILNFCSKGDHSKDLICNITGEDISLIGEKFINSLKITQLSADKKNVKYKDKCLAKNEISSKGKSIGFTLRSFVRNAIEEYLSDNSLRSIKVFKGPHPSSWKSDDIFLNEIKEIKVK